LPAEIPDYNITACKKFLDSGDTRGQENFSPWHTQYFPTAIYILQYVHEVGLGGRKLLCG